MHASLSDMSVYTLVWGYLPTYTRNNNDPTAYVHPIRLDLGGCQEVEDSLNFDIMEGEDGNYAPTTNEKMHTVHCIGTYRNQVYLICCSKLIDGIGST